MVLFYAGWSGKSSLRLSFESQFDDCEEVCMWVYERITPQTLGKTSKKLQGKRAPCLFDK